MHMHYIMNNIMFIIIIITIIIIKMSGTSKINEKRRDDLSFQNPSFVVEGDEAKP